MVFCFLRVPPPFQLATDAPAARAIWPKTYKCFSWGGNSSTGPPLYHHPIVCVRELTLMFPCLCFMFPCFILHGTAQVKSVWAQGSCGQHIKVALNMSVIWKELFSYTSCVNEGWRVTKLSNSFHLFVERVWLLKTQRSTHQESSLFSSWHCAWFILVILPTARFASIPLCLVKVVITKDCQKWRHKKPFSPLHCYKRWMNETIMM